MNTKNAASHQIAIVISTAIIVLCITSLCQADIVSSAELTDCIQTDKDITCDERMVFTVNTSYGLSNNLEILKLDPQGQGIEESIQLEITKTPPCYYFPLTYFHTAAYYPHEELRSAHDPTIPCSRECEDSPQSQCPTCGWVYHGQNRIEHSQGFCGGGVAHCIRMGDLYFHGYEIGPYRKTYDIKTKIFQGSEEHTFTIKPDNPLYSTKFDRSYMGDFNLEANLIGDQQQYLGVPELDNYILYIPAAPAEHPMVQDYQNNMLLVPREEVSKYGTELDKVAISYKTFRLYGSSLSLLQPGDGLGNQLFHKHNSDLQQLTINPNTETTYLIHGKRPFKQSMEFLVGMPQVLVYKPKQIQHSLVSFKIDSPAELKQIKTESKGIIWSAEIETFDSMSNNGVLNVLIKNIGDYKTDYIVMVTDATRNIQNNSYPAQARTLDPEQEITVKFDIHTQYNLNSSNELKVNLKSTSGKEYDSVWEKFDTEIIETKYPWQLYQQNKGSKYKAESRSYIKGDFNCDDKVDLQDLAIATEEWKPGQSNTIVMADLLKIAQCWLTGCL
ncbi:MAG: hypothetical protein KAS23_04510 [Anaerohalosphaera sp.]|nr:hypothetical protein [Anaerohalosphaera sp.]